MQSFGGTVALAFLISGCAGGGRIMAIGGKGGAGGSAAVGDGGLPPSALPTPTDGGTTPLRGSIKSDVGNTATVSGKPLPVRFTLELEDGSKPRVVWSVDDVRIGSIGDDGVFHANGFVGGVVTVTATVGSARVTTTFTVSVDIVDSSAGVPAPDQQKLKAGGPSGDPDFRWLYPYDRTVFPQGLAAPTLQLGGTAAQSTYLKISTSWFSYQQFSAAVNPLRVTIPEAVWKGLTLTAGATDTVTVGVTKLGGGVATGPANASWFIAQASLKGIVYYNTYKSPLAQNGGVMRIRAGQTAEVVVSGCTVCHSVSANGSVMAAALNNAPDERNDWNPVDSATYNLTPDGTAVPRTRSTEGRLFSFTALSPDGSMGLVNGLPPRRWPPFIARGVYASLGLPSKLVDTATGQDIPAPSLAALVQYAMTPIFSPDGAHVAFANGDRLGPACLDAGCAAECQRTCERVLTVLDVDGKAAPPVFSNARDVVTQTGAGKAVAWPTFLPDGAGIVYHEGDSSDSYVFTGGGAPQLPQHAELRLVEIQDRSIKTVNAVNGRLPTGALYLPYGDAVEGQMNYEPSVLPVAVGGYYWVLFTSRRAYGNTISPTSTAPSGANPFGTEIDPSPRKKLWIAAIDVDHSTKADPSHPAFYLPGQELESGNMRAFATLAPCRANGVTCESGADCCGGFCREVSRSGDGVPTLQCVPPPVNRCSNTYEICATAADCCDPANLCINSRCTAPGVPIP
jgi:hypothetical protein